MIHLCKNSISSKSCCVPLFVFLWLSVSLLVSIYGGHSLLSLPLISCFLWGVLVSGRGIIEPSKVASCRKCLHLQRASLTPELQPSVCMTVSVPACMRVYACVCVCVWLIVSHPSSPAGPSLNCLCVFYSSVCVCAWVCGCGPVPHPSALRWHITVNEWYLCSACMSGGRTREAKQALPNHLTSSLLIFFVSLLPVLHFRNLFSWVLGELIWAVAHKQQFWCFSNQSCAFTRQWIVMTAGTLRLLKDRPVGFEWFSTLIA